MSKLVLLTGASHGLGQAMALRFTAMGHRVVGLGRDLAGLQLTARTAGAGFLPYPCDISDPQAVEDAFAYLDRHGQLDILVNNAAVQPFADVLEETHASLMQVMAINFGGMAACSLLALQRFVPKGRGRIMTVSSFADIAPASGAASYSVSKGAGRVFTRAMVADLGDRFPQIVINDWMPGILDTRLSHGYTGAKRAPAQAAEWGVTLALRHDPSLTGTVWEGDRELLPPPGLKRRIFNRLTGKGRARQL